jgi:AcrR family transcriptional regulator
MIVQLLVGSERRDRTMPSSSADNRSRLLEAAAQAFGRRGFHATTTRDIAAAAGLSPAGLYVHHRNKEEILFRISFDGHTEGVELIRAQRASQKGPVDQLRAVVAAFAAWHARVPIQARVVNYELRALEPAHLEQIMRLRHAMDSEMRDILEAGVRSGDFHIADVKLTATAILSLGVDVARWHQDGSPWTPDAIGQAYADIALRIAGVAVAVPTPHRRRRAASRTNSQR